jgi:hypothetical protein
MADGPLFLDTGSGVVQTVECVVISGVARGMERGNACDCIEKARCVRKTAGGEIPSQPSAVTR